MQEAEQVELPGSEVVGVVCVAQTAHGVLAEESQE
jgi:hypothetical protein